ncbi:TetR/AcrR family transcriptional regulator [Aeromicrobium massiliense]|uniref:TetR/AcrR family transcriptional regulator n=1 Tax=Aeromicrobium massiliense TaxID=1464554 RepID=UPI0002FD7954|nr:TetR family transcriptional regulator [Aeromicrobium massiliense]
MTRTIEESRRDAKRRVTRASLVNAARALTARHGVHGFTVEQLCEQVGVSRRTFFNYFPTKDEAILGTPADELPADAVAAFLAGGGDEPFSADLAGDYVELLAAAHEGAALTREEHVALHRALIAEPRLLDRLMERGRAMEQRLATLVAEREGVDASDPRARVASTLLGALGQSVAMRFFSSETATSFRDEAAPDLQALRDLHLTPRP